MAYGDEINYGACHVFACTRSAVAVATIDQGLCGASNVVKTATDGPCGVAATGGGAQSVAPRHGNSRHHTNT